MKTKPPKPSKAAKDANSRLFDPARSSVEAWLDSANLWKLEGDRDSYMLRKTQRRTDG